MAEARFYASVRGFLVKPILVFILIKRSLQMSMA